MRLQQEVRAIRAATLFFTRLPPPFARAPTPDDQRRAMAYWPLLGWLTGGAVAGVWWLAALLFPMGVAVALALTAGLLLTGALHEDGFADVCDGFGGGATRERVLAIMRDSCIGTFGAVGVAMLLLLKWQTMAALPPALLPAAVIVAHALSRGGAATLMVALPYARADDSRARPLVGPLRGPRLALAGAWALAPLVLLPVRCWWAVAAVAGVRLAAGGWFQRRLGGYTGDCLGATQQAGEIACLLTIVALA